MGAFLTSGTMAVYADEQEQAGLKAEKATDLIFELASKQSSELANEPAIGQTLEPVNESAIGQTSEPVNEPAIEQTLEPVNELVNGQQTELADEQGDTLLTVKEIWLTGDLLNISVTDSAGEEQTLEVNLRDYAKPGDEYVTVQATDSAGHTSNAVRFKNPYYSANSKQSAENGENSDGGKNETTGTDNAKPFIPAGNGTVIDDATDGDGKEFFTVDTPDGNTFYLIVDRQRSTENVYLLDAVSENDLASLAKPGDGANAAVTETPAPAPTVTASPEPAREPEHTSVHANNSAGIIAFAVITVIVVGGIGYYFKIVRPKKNGEDEYASDGFDDDTEADLDGKDGDDE
jgi:hypothetical protein